MRSIDFIIQTLLIITALISGVTSWFLSEAIFLFALCQGAVFVWQIGSSVASLVNESIGVDIKRKHLLVAIFYLVSVFSIPAMIDHLELAGFFKAYTLYILIPALALSMSYYYITWKITFTKKKKGSFLPNLGF
jgi:hypothetical protein